MSMHKKAMHIDFAPRSLRRTLFHTHPALLALGAAGLLLCAGAAFGGWKLVEQKREREQQLRHIQQRAAAMSARPVEVARVVIPEGQAAFVNGAVMQLNLPWRELQDAVAAATPATHKAMATQAGAPRRSSIRRARSASARAFTALIVLTGLSMWPPTGSAKAATGPGR